MEQRKYLLLIAIPILFSSISFSADNNANRANNGALNNISFGVIIGGNNPEEEFKQIKADTAHFYIDWISMNFLAQQLLTLKRLNDALVIAENNVQEFPDKDLVLVTMGNIYLALNRKEDAILFYKKALAITPGYEEARNRLKELGESN